MAVTPEHDISLELLHLENTLAASEMWRAIVASPLADWPTVKALADAATSSEANARARIIWDDFDDSVDDEPPQALIRQLPDTALDRVGLNSWDVLGNLLLLIELPIPTDYRDVAKDSMTHFGNVVGRIIREMKDAVAATPAGLLSIERIQRGGIDRYDPDHVPEAATPGPDVPTITMRLIVQHRGAF
jgi:hypothetical protein